MIIFKFSNIRLYNIYIIFTFNIKIYIFYYISPQIHMLRKNKMKDYK